MKNQFRIIFHFDMVLVLFWFFSRLWDTLDLVLKYNRPNYWLFDFSYIKIESFIFFILILIQFSSTISDIHSLPDGTQGYKLYQAFCKIKFLKLPLHFWNSSELLSLGLYSWFRPSKYGLKILKIISNKPSCTHTPPQSAPRMQRQ